MLAVFDRGLKWLGKVFGHQESKVGVFRLVLLGFICVAVYHSQTVFVIFCGYLAGWIGAEGPDLVVKGRGVVYQLGFIKIPV